jgi:hypothetical protein
MFVVNSKVGVDEIGLKTNAANPKLLILSFASQFCDNTVFYFRRNIIQQVTKYLFHLEYLKLHW